MRFPIRLLRGRWPGLVERRLARFIWDDPRVIADDAATPEAFRKAMDAIEVGGTVKITAANRHPGADALLLKNVDTTGAVIVDIGASDGSTSADLIKKLTSFRSYIIADLFIAIAMSSGRGRAFFFDQDGRCILVCGRRLVAWPTRSRFVARLYSPLIRRNDRSNPVRREVLLLNPATRAVMAADPRVTYATHDIFHPWPEPAPDVIKVANVLGPYFSDRDISRALTAVLEGLADGGYLLLVDNGRITGAEPRAALYRRTDDRFALVDRTTTVPDIDVLAQQVRVGAAR